MGIQKRALEGSSRFNEDGIRGNVQKRIKSKPLEEVEAENELEPSKSFHSETTVTVTSEKSSSPLEAGENQNNRSDLHPGNLSFVRRKCRLCLNMVPQKSMKRMVLEEEKFILATMIPDRFSSNEHIDEFVQTKDPHVCFDHIVEASTRIEEHIKDPKAVAKILMPKIQSINANLAATRKYCILSQFLFRNKNRRVKPTQDALNFRCILCKLLRPRETMSRFSSVNAKTAIMVGYVLRGTQTIQQVQEHINTKTDQAICRKHVKKSTKAIYSLLEISNPQELSDCSPDLMEDIMTTANSLLPAMTIAQFKISVKELFRKLDPSRKPNDTAKGNRFCIVCSNLQRSCDMHKVTSTHVKTAIMAGGVLRGTHTIQQAQEVITLKPHVCRKHFAETIKVILSSLEIQHPSEVADCSPELMKNLMTTVNALLPNMTISQFEDAVREVAKKVDIAVMESVEELGETHKEREERCGVCQLLHPKDKFFGVTSERLKMLLMLGCVLRKSHTLKQAQSFIKSEEEVPSCRKHFRKSLQKILYFLNIESVTDISRCADEKKTKLMRIVNTLLPEMTISQFEKSVLKLAKKVEKFNEHRNLTA